MGRTRSPEETLQAPLQLCSNHLRVVEAVSGHHHMGTQCNHRRVHRPNVQVVDIIDALMGCHGTGQLVVVDSGRRSLKQDAGGVTDEPHARPQNQPGNQERHCGINPGRIPEHNGKTGDQNSEGPGCVAEQVQCRSRDIQAPVAAALKHPCATTVDDEPDDGHREHPPS